MLTMAETGGKEGLELPDLAGMKQYYVLGLYHVIMVMLTIDMMYRPENSTERLFTVLFGGLGTVGDPPPPLLAPPFQPNPPTPQRGGWVWGLLWNIGPGGGVVLGLDKNSGPYPPLWVGGVRVFWILQDPTPPWGLNATKNTLYNWNL